MAKRIPGPLVFTAILVLAIIATAIYYYHTSEAPEHQTELIETSDEVPNAINHLLSNDISDIEQTKKLDAQVEKFLKTWHIKGASIAIMKDEKLIYAKGYGWADEEKGVKMDVKHIMRVASLSKLITATAIMKLIEEKKLTLDQKVFGEKGILNDIRFLKITDKRVKNITIEHLLRHRGGFTLRGGDPMFISPLIIQRMSLDSIPTPEDVLEYSLGKKLGYEPGRGTRYSNLGYVALSLVISKVTGLTYEQYVKDSILAPIGCIDMHIANNLYQEKLSNEVRYYEPENEIPVEACDGSGRLLPRCYGGNNIRGLLGAGAWVASPTEFLRFIASIDGRNNEKDIISQKSIAYMVNTNPSELPIGWSRTSQKGEWTRSGSLSGTSALIRYQKDGYSWIFVTNTSSWKGSRFPRQIDALIRTSLQKVSDWPERNLFSILELKSNSNSR